MEGGLDQLGAGIVERASPGIAALFGALTSDGSHSILDLGFAGARHLRLLGRFARRIRFAGLVPHPPGGEALRAALHALPPNPKQPYDVVLAWDILDRVDPADRPTVVECLARVTGPAARLYAVVDTTDASTTRPTRSSLVGLDRISMQPVGPPAPARPPILPAPLERLLAPFEVAQAFTLRTGHREYVTIKRS
jgi:hypothetical protein